MKADERRKKLISLLLAESKAICGGALAKELGVSRQIIVQDIAFLRAEGHNIESTHDGYIIKSSPEAKRAIKVRHTTPQTEEELKLIIGLGGVVSDVFVWHKVYGKIEAALNIFSEKQVDQLVENIKSGKAYELMHVTAGVHYHTVRADSDETIDKIENALRERGFLVEDDK